MPFKMKNKNCCSLALWMLTLVSLSTPIAALARDREISVQGTCTREVLNDRGYIILTAETQEKDLKLAARKTATTYGKVLEAVKKLKLENADFQTVEYSVSSMYDWVKNHKDFKGFRIRMGLKITSSDIPRLGEVIEIASREEVYEVGQLITYLSPEKSHLEHEACLKEASENARNKAEKLTAVLRSGLGAVVNISESSTFDGGHPVSFARGMMNSMVASEAAIPSSPEVQAGKQIVTTTVQVTFEIK